MIIDKFILSNIIFFITLVVMLAYFKRKTLKYNHDLSEVKKLKNNFILLISHELRTPLTSIKGFSEALLHEEAGKISELQKDFLLTILNSAKKLETRIENIIEVTGFEKGTVMIYKKDVIWKDLIKKIYDSFAHSFKYQKLQSRLHIEEDIGTVKVDKLKIEKALSNLLLNAIKFTGQGGSIEISSVKNSGFIETTVIDTGVGISEKMKEKIFEKFVQIQDSLTRDTDGLGLGLTLTKKIIESHGGKIFIEAVPEGGTKVTFTVPL